MLYGHARIWFAWFKWGYFHIKVRERSGTHATNVSWTPRKVENGQLKAIFSEGPSQTLAELPDTLGVSQKVYFLFIKINRNE